MKNNPKLLDKINYYIGYEKLSPSEKEKLENPLEKEMTNAFLDEFREEVIIDLSFVSDYYCFKTGFDDSDTERYNLVFELGGEYYVINVYDELSTGYIEYFYFYKLENKMIRPINYSYDQKNGNNDLFSFLLYDILEGKFIPELKKLPKERLKHLFKKRSLQS